MTPTPTKEQEAVIEAIANAPGSLIVDALAGSAKTTTLKWAMQRLGVEGRLAPGQVLAVAFNKRIQLDLEAALPQEVTCRTLNGAGHAAWAGTLAVRPVLNTKKVHDLAWRAATQYFKDDAVEAARSIRALVAGAKSAGLVPDMARKRWTASTLLPDDDEVWDDIASAADAEVGADLFQTARLVLMASIEAAWKGDIDFDDQLYMPTLFGGAFKRYGMVLVDEAQDLSPLNHRMLKKMCGGRLIAVGDRRQAIYGFRGADVHSLDHLQEQWDAEVMHLTTCFRCDKAIVENVRWHAPAIQPGPAAGPGHVENLAEWSPMDFDANSAVICRNNAPLLRLAFRMLRQGVGFTILGGDLARTLKLLIGKLRNEKGDDDIGPFLERLQEWRRTEVRKAIKSGHEEKVARIEDKVHSIRALIGPETKTVGALLTTIDQVFDRSRGLITLTTGHKSKGFEFDTVYHLNPWLVPSKFALKVGGDALEQERNLQYVIETRAKHKLYRINQNKEGEEDDTTM